MNTASRWLLAFGLCAVATGISLDASSAAAQDVEITGPLAGAPAVRKMRIYRDGRFQLQPTFGMTINDEFSRTLLTGVQIGYYFTDWLGINAFFDYGAASFDTHLTGQVKSHGDTTSQNVLSLPSAGNFPKQISQLKFLSGVQATFIPLRGKLALFQALFVDTDFYIFGGAAFASVQERKDVPQGTCSGTMTTGTQWPSQACLDSQTASATGMRIAPTFGAGLSMYFTDYLALTLEYRAFPYKVNTSGTDEGGSNKHRAPDSGGKFPDGQIDSSDRVFHFNQMVSLGLAFYLPFQGELTK